MMAGDEVVARHVARPLAAFILVFPGSEVDQLPMLLGASGQLLPVSVDAKANWTWFPGTAAKWSAVAELGLIVAVILHPGSADPQPASRAQGRTSDKRIDIFKLCSRLSIWMPPLERCWQLWMFTSSCL